MTSETSSGWHLFRPWSKGDRARPFCLVPTAKWAAAALAKATLWSWGKPCPSISDHYREISENIPQWEKHGWCQMEFQFYFVNFIRFQRAAGIANTSCLFHVFVGIFQTNTWKPAVEHPVRCEQRPSRPWWLPDLFHHGKDTMQFSHLEMNIQSGENYGRSCCCWTGKTSVGAWFSFKFPCLKRQEKQSLIGSWKLHPNSETRDTRGFWWAVSKIATTTLDWAWNHGNLESLVSTNQEPRKQLGDPAELDPGITQVWGSTEVADHFLVVAWMFVHVGSNHNSHSVWKYWLIWEDLCWAGEWVSGEIPS